MIISNFLRYCLITALEEIFQRGVYEVIINGNLAFELKICFFPYLLFFLQILSTVSLGV